MRVFFALAPFGLSLGLLACGSATPEATHAPRPRRLVQAFAVHRTDDEHDLTEGFDAASLPQGIEAFHEGPLGYFRGVTASAASADAAMEQLRTFTRNVRVPPGALVLFGSSAPTIVRTYLVQTAPVVGEAGIARGTPTTRNGVAGIALTFHPDAFDQLKGALSSKGRVVVVVEGMVEAGSLELLNDGGDDPNDVRLDRSGERFVEACSEYTVFLALAPRTGEAAEARAVRLGAALPAEKPRACMGAPE